MHEAPRTPVQADWTFIRRLLIAIAVVAVVAAVWRLADILLLLFGSVLVAVMLRALADPLARGLGIGDRWALAVTVLVLLAVVAAGALLLGPEIVRQMRGLFERLPAAFARMSETFQLGSFADLLKGASPVSSLGDLASRIFAWSTTLLGVITSLALVLFGGVYLAVDPRLYRDGFVKLVPPVFHANVDAMLDDAGAALKRWLAGQLIAMLLVGSFVGVGMWLIGIPSAFALGIIAGVAEFVPIVGPIVAAIPALLIASTQGWEAFWWTIGVLVIVQQIESNVLSPLIAGRMVSVAPAVGLFAVVAMGVLFGPLGVLFGFPLAVVVDVAVRRLYVLDALGQRVEIMGEPATRSEQQSHAP